MKKEISERRKLEELVEELRKDIELEKAEKESVEVKLKELGGSGEEMESLGGHLEMKAIQVRESEEELEKKQRKSEEELEKKRRESEEELEKKRRESEEELEKKLREVDRRFEKYQLKEKKFKEQLAELRQKQAEFEVCEIQLNVKEREFGEKLAEFKQKQAEFEVRVVELNAKEREIDEKEKKCREPEICTRPCSYELREKKLEDQFNMLSKRMDELELKRVKDLESIEKQIEMTSRETVMKAKKPSAESLDHSSEVNIRHCVITSGKDIGMTEKSVEMTSGETVMKAKKPAESLVHPSEADIRYCVITSGKDIEMVEKSVEMTSGGTVMKTKKLSESLNRSSEENITIRMLTDGKDLQIFWNEYSVDYNSVKDVMETALKFSLDPAKLVLDAMEGFYPPHLKKGGVVFEEAVVRKNCIMLLEWLTKMSPYIEPAVKMEAKKLAFDWKRKMKSDAEHSLEVLAFVQLLAAFEIACKFRGELEKLLGIIAHYRQAPSLLRDLYFAEEMAIKEHRAEAAELISAFELDSEFPDIIVPKNTHKESSLAPLLGNNGAAPTISVPMSSSNTVLSTPESQTLLGCSNPISINSDSEQEEENDREDSEEENEDEFPPWIVSFVPECLKHDDTHIESLVLKIRSNQLRCIEISDIEQSGTIVLPLLEPQLLDCCKEFSTW